VEFVDVVMRILQARQFQADADKAAKAVKGVGDASETAGKKAGMGWKGVAKWAGGAAAIYAGTRFLEGSIKTTEQLGASTIALNRTTGLSIKQSSEWAAVLKARNINSKTFQIGMVALSRQMVRGATDTQKYGSKVADLNQQFDEVRKQGGKGAAKQLESIGKQLVSTRQRASDSLKIWHDLGVNMDDIRKGDTSKVMLEVSDGLAKMKNPAERAAYAQKLLGRAGIQLAPVFFRGSKAIKEQLAVADKYGLSMSGKNAKDVRQGIKDQRELQMAYTGVQVSLGRALLPVMIQISKIILKVADVMQPLIRRGWLLKGLIGALVVAFVALKGVLLAAKVAQAAVTLGELGLNAAFMANPIFLVIAAIALLVVGIIYAWKHFKWFRDAVYDVWNALKWAFNWAKQNWPLLVGILGGPFGLAVAYIVTHWAQVKAVIFETWDWIKKHWPLLVAILGGPIALAVQQIIAHWDSLKQAVGRAIDWMIKKVKEFLHLITGIPDKLTGLVKKLPGGGLISKATHYATHPWSIFTGQHGGVMPYPGGTALVGEAGPEIIRLPVGGQVLPLPQAGMAGLGGEVTVRVPVFLDRRQIAEAVGQFTADKLARR
jgi:hypothetical protein